MSTQGTRYENLKGYPFSKGMIYGVDIGGFHVKITQLTRTNNNIKINSAFIPFRQREELTEILTSLTTEPGLAVVTQTICGSRRHFSSIKEGTHYVIDIVGKICGEGKVRYPGLPCHLYTAEEAKKDYLKVAARNWVATSYLASPYLDLFEHGLVIDCGTTSTDIIPVIDSCPITLEDNDQVYMRLRTNELLWSGLYFTLISQVSNTVTLDGEEFRIKSSSRFLSFDIYVVLGLISAEDIAAKYYNWLQEMRLVSYDSSIDKMLDLICADRDVLGVHDAKKIAAFLAEKQVENTENSIKKVLSATKKKYGHDMKIAGIAGAGKDIILRRALENLAFEEIIDIEKAASETLDMGDSESNCETSLGCALMGLQAYNSSAHL